MTDLATRDLSATPFTWRTLTTIADTEMVPRGLRGNPPAMLAAIYLGREIGLGPMQSMQMIDVIDGRPSLSAELQTALIREAGHSMTCPTLTDETVTVSGRRADNDDELEVTYSLEMAKRAGLLAKRNWQQYPEAMLWARAVSMLARMLFADVFAAAHAYTPDDLGDDTFAPSDRHGQDQKAPADLGSEADGLANTTAEVMLATDRSSLEDRLIQLLGVAPDSGGMRDIEARLRQSIRLAERLGLVRPVGGRDYLHHALWIHGANHTADLTRAELVKVSDAVRTAITDALTASYSRATLTNDAGP